jgi:hypothetical protein
MSLEDEEKVWFGLFDMFVIGPCLDCDRLFSSFAQSSSFGLCTCDCHIYLSRKEEQIDALTRI